MSREAGQRSPVTGILKPLSGGQRSANTFSRQSPGMSKSGSSFIGVGKRSWWGCPSGSFLSSTQVKV